MLQILKNGLRKKVAILLIVCLVFCTNSFNTLSTVYADDGETKVERQIEKPSDEEEAVEEKGEGSLEEKVSEEKASEEESSEEAIEKASDNTSGKISTNSEADEDAAAEEVLNDEEPEEDILIATESEPEVIIDEVEDIATKSDAEYMELDAYNQFMYQDEDAVSYYDGTIILLKDIKLKDAIYFKDDATLDLSGHKLTGPEDNYALYVEDNFTLINSGDILGKIEGDNNEFPTIYVKNATAEFAGGEIYGASGKDAEIEENKKNPSFGGDALHIYDSNIVVSGALIYGGTGLKSYNVKGGDGGDAVVVLSSLTSNTILISEGGVVGGKGGDGYGDEKPGLGAAIKVDRKSYVGQYLGKGLKGNIGGGKGGTAVNIKTDKFKSENLTYEHYTISAGDSGYSTSISKNEEMIKEHILFASGNGEQEESEVEVAKNNLFGAGVSDRYYSLHDLNGKNYLTSLKYQNPTGLCTAFAMAAYAETNLIKKYPDYVKNDLNKNIDDTLDLSKWHSTTTPGEKSSDNANELNLSEMQFGMQLFAQPRDEFGNAGLSKHTYKTSTGTLDVDWEDYGSSSYALSLTSTTWRSLVEEDNETYWPEWGDAVSSDWNTSAGKTIIGYAPGDNNYMDILNNRTNKTVVHAKEALVRDAGDFYNGTTFKRDEFIEQAKKDILKYNGFEFFIYTCGAQNQATFPDGSHRYVKNGVDYGEVMSLDAPDVYNEDLGGHALYCIGWDDDIEFDGSFGHYTGAFICKNSWHQFTLVPYDNSWGVIHSGSTQYMDYMVVDFVPSFSEYENIYFYDTGVGTTYYEMDSNEFSFNVFKIKNEKERIKAVSFYTYDEGTFDVSLYKVSSLDNVGSLKNDLNNANNKKYTANVTVAKGYNTIKIDGDGIDCSKDEMYAVVLEGGSFNMTVDDSSEGAKETYVTVAQGRSFYGGKDSTGRVTYTVKYPDGPNARIRLISNNSLKLNAISNSGNGNFGGSVSTWVDPILRASLSYIPEPTPEAGKVFVNYNTEADGSGITYTTDSIYHQDIAADTLVLYAQYNDSADNRTLTFDKNDPDATGEMQAWTRATGTMVTVPTASYEKIGYRFDHWTLNDTSTVVNVGDDLTLNDDTTLKAVWVPKNYHIDYELYGATFTIPGVDTISYVDELDVPATASMTYVGHEFRGWYDNEAFSGSPVRKMKVDRNDPKDLRYYALWDIQRFTISFNLHGHGQSIEDRSVDYGNKIVEPDTPTESGYAFMGWFTDGTYATRWNFNDKVYADRTLHASWSEAINVVFDTLHGRAPANQYIVEGGTIATPAEISVIGYDFIHWYENDEETPFDFTTIIHRVDGETRTLHAKWNVKTYSVTLNTNGGTINSGNITSYTYGVGATLPTSVKAPSSSQYFVGWYENASFKGNVVKSISTTDYGDKVYYAKYEKQSSGGDSSSRGGNSSTGGSSTAGNVMSPAFTDMMYGPNPNPINDTTINVSLKTIPVTMDTLGSTWETDANGKTHLVIKNSIGVAVEAKNVFACVVTKAIDKNGRAIDVQDFYYLDNNGNMYTGWLRDTSNLNYYFTEESGYNQGKLARGWTKIKGDYYYFDGTGNLQKNIITPDGFAVDGNGKWLENAWQDGFINVNVQKTLTDEYNVITSKDNVIVDGGADANKLTGGANQSNTTNSSGGSTKKQVGKKLNK